MSLVRKLLILQIFISPLQQVGQGLAGLPETHVNSDSLKAPSKGPVFNPRRSRPFSRKTFLV